MTNYEILRITPGNYLKCSNIWDMGKQPEMARHCYDELVSGNRIYVYIENGEYLGEGSLVLEENDPEYCIPGQRIYFSRLVVKKDQRNRGIGSVLEVS